MPDHSISQIELIAAIFKDLNNQGAQKLLPREIDTIIRCADEIVAELRKPERKVTPGMGIDAWLASDHTGVSSLFMAGVLRGYSSPIYGHPHDPDDFGRCVGLLDACPELRAELPKMAGRSSQWAALVGAWEEIEAMYRKESPSGKAPRTYARMREVEAQNV